ncbi:MAG: hypothetical protein IPM39_25015 [Chloroflexi bacterium]|nr:hypothetical protein [Chloroflexota bacterium]
MTQEEFEKLSPGDKLQHPQTGVVVVKHTYLKYVYDTVPARQVVWALETEDGRYLKEQDRDVAKVRKVK